MRKLYGTEQGRFESGGVEGGHAEVAHGHQVDRGDRAAIKLVCGVAGRRQNILCPHPNVGPAEHVGIGDVLPIGADQGPLGLFGLLGLA